MTNPSFLSKPEQVSPEWINQVFRHGGFDYHIDDFSRESIGTGQIGENVRFTFSAGENAPKSIVGKFMSLDPISRETGIQQETYIKEVLFYQHLQSKVDIQTPKIYYVNCHHESHEFVILMEDLAPGHQGDQIQGCSVDDAALALEQLAKLHGPTWGDETLLQHKLLGRSDDEEKLNQLQMIYRMVLPGFLNRYAHRLSGEHITIIEQMMELLPFYTAIYTGPKALIHADYRLDNMMFGGPYPLAVVDWQTISIGCGLSDASYCLGTSLFSVERQKEEEALLKHYLEVLVSYKVDLNWNDCWKYYRAYSASGLIMAVIASMIVEETDRGNDMFVAMATRSCQQVIELECFDVIRKA